MTYVPMSMNATPNGISTIYCSTKIYPRPHEESNLDLAFRKRSFYPLNYRGGERNYKTR